MSIKRIYVGSIVNRDLEFFEKIVKFAKINYNIKIVNLLPDKGNKKGVFNVKYFQKKLKKYPLSLIIVKLLSDDSNKLIYNALKSFAPKIPLLNSLNAVKICESRKATFNLIERKYNKLNLPKSFYSFNQAIQAIRNGKKIIVKYDIHNAPNLSKEERILGIASSINELKELIIDYNKDELFFQEYLGKINIIYKAYLIDRWIVSITSYNWLREKKLTPYELVRIRVPIDKELKRKIRKLGRKFGMSVFGVDYILTKEGKPYIIDVNDFPSYRYIPEATSLISDYIYEFLMARQKIDGRIPMKLKSRTYMT
jgi:glutathione synthase/RimK-type ligase-like ATP-grasp enzyme